MWGNQYLLGSGAFFCLKWLGFAELSEDAISRVRNVKLREILHLTRVLLYLRDLE